MPVSLSDATSVEFVGCKASDTLAGASHQYGYLITVSLSGFSVLGTTAWVFSFKDLVHELWTQLQEISGDALAVQSPEPVADDTHFDFSAHATIAARTLGNAAYLTCGELASLIGQRSALAVARIERVSVDAVRGADRIQTRAEADAAADDAVQSNNPIKAVGDVLKTIGISIGVAIAVALLVVGVIYFKRK